MRTEPNNIKKKSLALILAAAFLVGPAVIGGTTAAAQEYYPDDRYSGYPPDPGYPPADRDYPPPTDRAYPPPPADRGYAPPPADRGYAPPSAGYADYRLSPQQLENLLAPVALYPDPVLAQILLAATFVDQVQDAAHWMRRYNDPYGVDSQPWDTSVKAIAHYPSVLFMMGDRVDWTTALGQAYVEQPADVTAAIQHLRWMAQRTGNLVTNDYWEVVPAGGFIEILPIQPRFIYLPVYEPAVVFIEPFTFVFGPAFVIGPWLNCDWDWRGHRIYYHGWHGPRWVERSRPYVRITNVYVNDRFRNVRVNRDVVRRSVNVENLNRFTSVHRDANFANLERRNLRDRNTATNEALRRERERSRFDAFRGRPGTDRPATRDERAARLRQERSSPALQNGPGQTREERLRQGRDDRAARLNQERQSRMLENSRRNPNDRNAGVDNRPQFRESRPQSPDNRAQRLREENRRQFLENRPPQSFENRDMRSRGERSPVLENRGRRGGEDRSRFVRPPTQEQPGIQQAPRSERRVEAQQRRESAQPNHAATARAAEKARAQDERRSAAG